MTDPASTQLNRPTWVDLATRDAASARDYYRDLFGWDIEVNEDPQYGGYGLARVAGRDVAGIGGTQTPEEPTAWNLYIGTDDVDGLAGRFEQAGGRVIAPPFDVGDQGRMSVLTDPTGAFISAWQGTRMGGFQTEGVGAYAWAELNARGLEKAIPFYETVFGWTARRYDDPGAPAYTEFHLGEEPLAGAWEIQEPMPADVPSHWLVYFGVENVDVAHDRAVELGGRSVVEPRDFPGGRFAVVADPQGGTFGVLRLAPGR